MIPCRNEGIAISFIAIRHQCVNTISFGVALKCVIISQRTLQAACGTFYFVGMFLTSKILATETFITFISALLSKVMRRMYRLL